MRSSRSNRRAAPRTPSQHVDEDDDFMDENFEQTPSAIGASDQSKKTRFGSTDEHGNRLSNMPGENRPSLTSVTPYDDNADTMIRKVEKVAAKMRTPKVKKGAIGSSNEAHMNRENTLGALEKENEKLMISKKVVANEGK